VVVMWTYCVWFFTRDRSQVSVKKVLTNPVVVSVLVGAIMFLLSYEPTGAVETVVNGMANLNTGLGMLLMGVFLAQSDMRSLVRTRSIYKASFFRLVVASGLCIAVTALWPTSQACKVVALIAFVTPCGASASMFAQLFGGDYRFGAGLATISTLLSLVTMPIMLMIGLMLY
jgi:malate permease and related proteins